MTPHAAFIARICARPEDDGPRHLFADFLRDEGEWDRAEFICCQVEIASILARGKTADGYTVNAHSPMCDRATCDLCPLRRREHELKTLHNLVCWTPQIAAFADVDKVEFHRGFVSEITCSCEDWQRSRLNGVVSPFNGERFSQSEETIGQAILRAAPVEIIEFPGWGQIVVSHREVDRKWALHHSRLNDEHWVGGGTVHFPTRDALIDAMPETLRQWETYTPHISRNRSTAPI